MLRLHVRDVPMLVLIGLLYLAPITLTNYTYNILEPTALSTRYVLDYLFIDDPTQFAGVPSSSGIVGEAPESRT